MYSRFIGILLVILFSVKSFGFVLVIDDHHHVSEDDVHGYFHTIGQPHSHDKSMEDDLTDSEVIISYSDEAVEHSNENQDRASIFIFELSQMSPLHSATESVIPTRLMSWDPPFIEYSPPPPKA